MIRLTHEPIDYAAVIEAVRDPHAGGVVVFLGTVRELTGEEITTHLEYEAYPEMAEVQLRELEAAVRRRWPVKQIVMIHRLGRLGISEVSVAVAVSCPHRVDAFAACQYAIDTLKAQIPIWKRDNPPVSGTQRPAWVHPDNAT